MRKNHIQNILAFSLSLLLFSACYELDEPWDAGAANPSLTTGDAINLGYDSVTLSGTIDDLHGNYTDYYYSFILTPASAPDSVLIYDWNSAWDVYDYDTSTNTRIFTKKITGLTPEKSYNYYFRMTDKVGQEIRSEIRSFTTLSYAGISSLSFTDADGKVTESGEEYRFNLADDDDMESISSAWLETDSTRTTPWQGLSSASAR